MRSSKQVRDLFVVDCWFSTFLSFLHRMGLLVSDEMVSEQVTILIITHAFRLHYLKGTKGLDEEEKTPWPSFNSICLFNPQLSQLCKAAGSLQFQLWSLTYSPCAPPIKWFHLYNHSTTWLHWKASEDDKRRKQKQQLEARPSSAFPLRTLSIGSSADSLSVPKTSSATF